MMSVAFFFKNDFFNSDFLAYKQHKFLLANVMLENRNNSIKAFPNNDQ